MSQEKSPNIVFVFSDQQRYSALGANGNDVIQTPILDAMAAEGMVCDNMFSQKQILVECRAERNKRDWAVVFVIRSPLCAPRRVDRS